MLEFIPRAAYRAYAGAKAALLLAFAAWSLPAGAQEFSLLAGQMRETDSSADSYAWAIEYQHALGEHAAFSFSWLNEGHLPNNHRDGQSVQLWTRTRAFDPRLTLAAGVGPYHYFDTTRARQATSYDDDHGWGVALDLAATWYPGSRWFYQLRAQRIIAGGGFNTTSILAGIGYQLEAPLAPGPVTAPLASSARTTRNELTVSFGRSIVNSFASELGVATSIEYRRGLTRHLDWTLAWLDEGDARLIRRDGVLTQLWLVRDFLQQRLALGVGGGLYWSVDRYRERQPGEARDELRSGIVTATASYRFGREWLARASWNRIITDYNRDTDVILLGLGYRF